MNVPKFILEYRASDGAFADREPKTEGITEFCNIRYADYGDRGLLDVYYPAGTTGALPTILCMHGGGFAHGNKDACKPYAKFLAGNGFTVINFNYRLAPEYIYPTQVLDVGVVARWMCEHAAEYFVDMKNVFLFGNSSSAQVMSQYAAAWANPAYAALLGAAVPDMRIGALCFSGGGYHIGEDFETPSNRPGHYYFGIKPMERFGETLDLSRHMTPAYPPAYVTTAECDYMRGYAAPYATLLMKHGIETVFRIYHNDSHTLGHCFNAHHFQEGAAAECNAEHIAFCRKHIR